MTNQADVGRKAIVNGYTSAGTVIRVMGRTVEIEMPYGIVATDQDNVFLLHDPR